MFSHSCQWFWSAQTLERDSQAGWMFSHSCQWFWSAQTLERDSHPGWMFSHSCQSFWSAQTLERDSLSRCGFSHLVSGNLLNHWRVTHILDVYPNYLISKIHVHHIQSYQSVLQKHLSDLNNLCKGMPHTYCHHFISISLLLLITILHSHSEQHVNLRCHKLKS